MVSIRLCFIHQLWERVGMNDPHPNSHHQFPQSLICPHTSDLKSKSKQFKHGVSGTQLVNSLLPIGYILLHHWSVLIFTNRIANLIEYYYFIFILEGASWYSSRRARNWLCQRSPKRKTLRASTSRTTTSWPSRTDHKRAKLSKGRT